MELDKEHKVLHEFTKKLVVDIKEEFPSANFTIDLMQQINALETKKSKILVYNPLISTKVWWVLGLFFVLTCTFTFITSSSVEFTFLDKIPSIGFSFMSEKISAINLPQVTLSKQLMYSLGILSILFLIQVVYIKETFDKKNTKLKRY